ncbi:MAG: prepilin-type N-terminal cleavage/methylation domain-containing protein [Geminicoccaceae bacterium]|nr:prepilin-type N-terminal cleavage/methylation domain-containing protein [Geminicoccaceae bacterium]
MSGRRAAGFTLLEVLVALAVLALVLGVSWRILGGATAAVRSREAVLRLAGFADAAWQDLRLQGRTDAASLSFDWPDDIALTITELPLPPITSPDPDGTSTAGLSPLAEDPPLRHLRFELSDEEGYSFALDGVLRLRLPPGEVAEGIEGDRDSGEPADEGGSAADKPFDEGLSDDGPPGDERPDAGPPTGGPFGDGPSARGERPPIGAGMRRVDPRSGRSVRP